MPGILCLVYVLKRYAEPPGEIPEQLPFRFSSSPENTVQAGSMKAVIPVVFNTQYLFQEVVANKEMGCPVSMYSPE